MTQCGKSEFIATGGSPLPELETHFCRGFRVTNFTAFGSLSLAPTLLLLPRTMQKIDTHESVNNVFDLVGFDWRNALFESKFIARRVESIAFVTVSLPALRNF